MVGYSGLGGSTADLFFDATGNLYGVHAEDFFQDRKGFGGAEPNYLINIDQVTGEGTLIGPIGFKSVSGLAYNYAPSREGSPILTELGLALSGTLIVNGLFESVFDSSRVFINREPISSIGSNQVGPFSTSATLSGDGPITVRLVGYRDLAGFPSNQIREETLQFKAAAAKYSTNFTESTGSQDFLQNRFSVTMEEGFGTIALHSPHPYDNSSEYAVQLLTPIVVAQENAFFQYKDIALVEPELDFVAVEGSMDGLNWVAIANPYDASFDPSWETAFTTGQVPSTSLFRDHTIDLLETFSPGDTVLFRFRMKTDAQNIGWGWVIDNINIQDTEFVTGVDKEALEERLEFRIIPNPVSREAVFSFRLAESGQVSYQVLNSLGAVVDKRDLGFKTKGEQLLNWENKSINQGLYLVRLITESGVVTERMIVR